jgi:hypothetical protein
MQLTSDAKAAAQARAQAKAELAAAIHLARVGLSGRGGSQPVGSDSLARSESGGGKIESSHRESSGSSASPGDILAAAIARPVSWVIVLTACIAPLPGVTHTLRASPQLRTRDYARALRRWAGAPYPHPIEQLSSVTQAAETVEGAVNASQLLASSWLSASAALPPWPVVVVESSGANLTSLRRAVAEGYAAAQAHQVNHPKSRDAGHSGEASFSLPRGAGQRRRRARRARRAKLRPIEFVSAQLTRAAAGEEAGDGSLARGKGVAEAASIVTALERSELVRRFKPTHAVKVTGRYFVRNLDAELHLIANGAAAAAAATAGNIASGASAAPVTVAGETATGTPSAATEVETERATREDTSLVQQAAAALFPSGEEPWPLLALQSTPSPWSLWDGVVRSEVVGFALCDGSRSDRSSDRTSTRGHNRDCDSDCSGDCGSDCSISDGANSASSGAFAAQGVARWAEALFAGQDEAVGRPMERVLFEGARGLREQAHPAAAAFSNADVGLPHAAVQRFGSLEVDSTRNAENNLVVRL